jgi:hypothetical protein
MSIDFATIPPKPTPIQSGGAGGEMASTSRISAEQSRTWAAERAKRKADAKAIENFSAPANNTEAPTWKFPDDLENQRSMIAFHWYKRTKRTKQHAGLKNKISSIYLPLPGNLQHASKAAWENANLGAIGEMGRRMGEEGLGGLEARFKAASTKDIAKSGMALLESLVVGNISGTTGAIAGAIPGKGKAIKAATGAGIGTAAKAALGGAGVAVNPHKAMLFSGVDFRTHQFTYKLVPKGQTDSWAAAAIIKEFRRNMLPTFRVGGLTPLSSGQVMGSNMFFTYPNECEIEILIDGDPYAQETFMQHIFTSVLTDISVNYHGEGTPQYFATSKAPVSMEISLSFTETTIRTADDVDNVTASGEVNGLEDDD